MSFRAVRASAGGVGDGVIASMVNTAVGLGMVGDDGQARAVFAVQATRQPVATLREIMAFREGVIRASSVKSTDKPRPPAKVSNVKRSGKTPKVSTERPKPWTGSTDVPARASAAQQAPTEYPASWGRPGRGQGSQWGVRAALGVQAAAVADPRAFMASTRERAEANQRAAQASRTGHYDRHSLIAAAGDNAARLREYERADIARMQREQQARAAG